MRQTKYFLESDILEAVTQSSFTTKVFLQISQWSQETTTPESFLIKWQAGRLQPSLKRDFVADIFPVNVEKFSKKTILDKMLQKNSRN